MCVSRGLRGGYRLLHDALAMMSKVRTNLLHEPWLSGLRGPYAGVGRRALCRTCRRQGLFCREPLDLYTGHGLPCVGVCGACTRLTLPVMWFVRARPACTGQALPSHLRPYAQAMPCLRALSCTRGVRGPRYASSHICACALSMRWLSRPSACTSVCACTGSHCLPAVFVIDSDALTLSCVRMHVLHVLHVPHVPHVLHVLHALRVQG